jgi:hypothetical protein
MVATVTRRRGAGLSAAWLVFALLFVGTVAGVTGFASITQPWHVQWFRISAALGLLTPVLAGLGMATVIAFVWQGCAALRAPSRVRAGMVAIIVLAIAIGGSYGSAQGQSIVRDAWHSSELVQASDLELFRDLAEMTGPEDRVFNSPRDGSGWMYALYDVIPMNPYIYRTPRWSWDLVNGLGRHASPRGACARIAYEDLTHAVVKDVTGSIAGIEDYDIGGFIERHPGLFVEVARTPSAVAYRIDQAALAVCAGL